jgi:hypothetical protein
MHGDSVKRLQRALGVDDDGDYGKITASAVRGAKSKMGFPADSFDTGATEFFQQILFGNREAPDEYVKRAHERKAARNAGKTDGEKAVAFLMERVGRTEIAPGHGYGSNRNPEWLDKWQVENGHGKFGSNAEDGWAWCGVACWAGYKYGAHKDIDPRIRSVEWAYYASGAGTNGLYRIPLGKVDKGDFLVLFSSNTHIATARGKLSRGEIPTVEGNTSFENSGDQANGGALAARERPQNAVVAAIRVRRG